MKFRTFLHTDAGDREQNEDYAGYRVRPWKFSVFAVADGLGGHDAGEVAASAATHCLIEAFSEQPSLAPEALKRVFSAANDAVCAAQGAEHGFYSMKTTLAAAFYRRGKIAFAHVGDSRIYLFRRHRLIYQSCDHSLAQLQVSQGKARPEDIRGHADRNQLLRALGGVTPTPDITDCIRIRRGDAILLCTDGFWENVCEQYMEDSLSIANDPETWVRLMLHQHAKQHAERRDNFTALAVFAGFGS